MLTYNKLGRHAEAEAAFAKTQAKYGDRRSFCYVELYAQWGDKARALDWLETGMVLRTPDLTAQTSSPRPAARRTALSGDRARIEASGLSESVISPR
jgi:hypothetical protein